MVPTYGKLINMTIAVLDRHDNVEKRRERQSTAFKTNAGPGGNAQEHNVKEGIDLPLW
jgi:hypothetical protein